MPHNFTLQGLHDEIENDLLGLGYKEVGGEWKRDNIIADLINVKNYKVDHESVLMETVRAETTYAAYNTLAIDEQDWIRWMTPNSGNFMVTADMKLQLTGRSLAIDGSAGTGDNNQSFWSAAHRNEISPIMLALIEVNGSRADVLWGGKKIVSISEVAHSANL